MPWIAFRPDGAVMLTASIAGGALAWDLTRSPPVPRRLSDEESLRTLGVAFSPDGKLVAAGSADGRVALWDGRTLEPVGPPTVGSGVMGPLRFTSDGAVLATTSDDRTVRLYDVTTRQQIGVPFPKRSVYGQASLSADGRTLVISGSGGDGDLGHRSPVVGATGVRGRRSQPHPGRVGAVPPRHRLSEDLPAVAVVRMTRNWA